MEWKLSWENQKNLEKNLLVAFYPPWISHKVTQHWIQDSAYDRLRWHITVILLSSPSPSLLYFLSITVCTRIVYHHHHHHHQFLNTSHGRPVSIYCTHIILVHTETLPVLPHSDLHYFRYLLHFWTIKLCTQRVQSCDLFLRALVSLQRQSRNCRYQGWSY